MSTKFKSLLEAIFHHPPGTNRKTFEYDETLPSLPVPDLKHTLERYLDSVKPFTTPEEYQKTVAIVEAFEFGIGGKLNEKLKEKARTERNWIEKWWEDYAYLRCRSPLLPFSDMVGVCPRIPGWTYGTEKDQIRNASFICYNALKFWVLIRNQELKQDGSEKLRFSMSQYRRLYNTARLPGEAVDSLFNWFKTAEEGSSPTNIIIMCRGRLFTVEAIDKAGAPLTPPAWEVILEKIVNICNSLGEGQNIGVLTCDERTSWSKNRKHLMNISRHNEKIMDIIERSLFVLVLDDAKPESVSVAINYGLSTGYNNRWSDKAMGLLVYKNGLFGSLADHTAFDGIASMGCLYYIFTAMSESGSKWSEPIPENSSAAFVELVMDLDYKIKAEIDRVTKLTSSNGKKTFIARHNFKDFGRSEIQRLKFHPDTFVQLALQLAYHRLHKKPAPCYETATTRAFYNGRTETVRSCTPECIEWVKAMLNEKLPEETKMKLMVKASNRHANIMAEARDNAGCDRHLFGLQCIAIEEGIPMPELYKDPAYEKSGGGGNFVLSTSFLGYSPLSGGVTPMCQNGYGVFYGIINDEILITISVNQDSEETDMKKFFDSVSEALTEMRSLILASVQLSKL